MTKTPTNESAVYWSHNTDGDTYDNNNPLGYRCFQIGRILAKYNLFNPTIFIQNLVYTDFRIILTPFFYPFLETRTLDRTRKGFDQLLSNLCFSLYPLIFSLQSL